MSDQVGERGSLGIVVVNYGSHVLLAQNLAEVSASVPDARVVVVDNFKSADDQAAVATMCSEKGWDLVVSAVNLGFGGGMNLGVEHAMRLGVEHLLLLNPDARIDGRSISTLRARVAMEPLTMVAPLVLDARGAVWSEGTDLLLSSGNMSSVHRRSERPDEPYQFWLSGACLMLSTELWRRVGGFYDPYFLYWEDVDFSFRVVQEGGALAIEPQAVCIHDEGGTQQAPSSRAKSETYYYYNVRNRLLFAARNLEEPDRRRWRRGSARAAYRILLRGGKRQFAHPVAPLRAAVTGTASGLRAVVHA